MARDCSPWGNLRRRLEQAAGFCLRNSTSDGLTAVEVRLYFRADGTLVGWEEPKTNRFEPARVDWVSELSG